MAMLPVDAMLLTLLEPSMLPREKLRLNLRLMLMLFMDLMDTVALDMEDTTGLDTVDLDTTILDTVDLDTTVLDTEVLDIPDLLVLDMALHTWDKKKHI